MNDEPSSSAAAAAPPFLSAESQDGEAVSPAIVPDVATTVAAAAATATLAASVAARKQQHRNMFNRKRGELLDDLLRNLDILVYAELSIIYYMDCFFFRFIIRSLVQLIFLTPKPAMLPEPPANRPYIGAIFGSNLMCIILHIFGDAPAAGEATRGYLHGGLAMDFIGQKGPTSKPHLVLLDLLVLVLQIVHLAAHALKQRLREESTSAEVTRLNRREPAPTASAGQNLDDEERGIRHSVELRQRHDVEMQTLNPRRDSDNAAPISPSRTESGDPHERDNLLSHERSSGPNDAFPNKADAHIFDAFNSGQIVLADLNLTRTIKDQYWMYQKIAAEAPGTAETRRLIRQRLTGGVMRWPFHTRLGQRQ